MNKPQSLYIHIPFCSSVCDYCDFCKLQYFRIIAEKYIKALIKEIDSYKINEPLKTIYIGGGTPTSLDDDLFEQLLKYLDKYANDVIEYTVEANPESLSNSKLKLMKEHGVNRLSIGWQTTNNEILKDIGRKHTYEQALDAFKRARDFGFNNINIDIIAGLPGINKTDFLKDLEKVVETRPEHLSIYSLTVHEHTAFFHRKIKEPSQDEARDLYDIAHDYLKRNAYEHYEVSNWALNKKYAMHNLTYWQNNEYYGVGLSASGFINHVRYTNTFKMAEYLKGNYINSSESQSEEDEKESYIFLNLRTKFGIDFEDYNQKFHEDFLERNREQIHYFQSKKYLNFDEKHLYLTYDGLMIMDSIIIEFI